MSCPVCGAATYEDNLGRWFCSQQCGWNSGYTMGDRYGMSTLWRRHTAEPVRGLVVRQLRMEQRNGACARTARGSLRA